MKPDQQLALDEILIENDELEEALEDRWSARKSSLAVSAAFRAKDEAARKLIDKHVPVDIVARVGRFRIERKPTESRHVSFDTEAGVRLTIDAEDE